MSRAAEQRARALLTRLPSRCEGAEIGVFRGDLSRRLLARKYLRLHMIDSWATSHPDHYAASGDFHATLSQAAQDAYMAQALDATAFAGPRRFVHRLDSLTASQAFPAGSLDFVFIDADHSYDGCSADIAAWMHRVKPGGLLGGHDYANERYPGFGVTRAVDEAVASFGWTLDLGENYTWFVRV